MSHLGDPNFHPKMWWDRKRKQDAEKKKALEEARETAQLKRETTERKRSRKWLDQCQKVADIIKKERETNESDLLEQSGLSIWVFKKLKPHFLEMNPDIIYNKKEKKYFFNNNNESKVSLSFSEES